MKIFSTTLTEGAMRSQYQTFLTMKSILALLSLFFLLVCCRKQEPDCKETQEIHYQVSDEAKAMMPYKQGDSIVFVSNNDDTASLVANAPYASEVVEVGENPTCPPSSRTHYHYYSVELSGTNPLMSKLVVDIDPKNLSQYGETFNISKNGILMGGTSRYWIGNGIIVDSILLNNRYVTGVSVDHVLYNRDFGILKISDLTGIAWTKIK
jgi:hypothetical protein